MSDMFHFPTKTMTSHHFQTIPSSTQFQPDILITGKQISSNASQSQIQGPTITSAAPKRPTATQPSFTTSNTDFIMRQRSIMHERQQMQHRQLQHDNQMERQRSAGKLGGIQDLGKALPKRADGRDFQAQQPPRNIQQHNTAPLDATANTTTKPLASLRLGANQQLRIVDPRVTTTTKPINPPRKRSYSDPDIASHHSDADFEALDFEEEKRAVTPPPGTSPSSVGRDESGIFMLERSQQEPVSWIKPKSLVLSKMGQATTTNYLRERRERRVQEEPEEDDMDDRDMDMSDFLGEWEKGGMDSPMPELIHLDSTHREKMFLISRHITELEEIIREHEEQERQKRRQEEWDTESEGEEDDLNTSLRQSRVILVKNEEE